MAKGSCPDQHMPMMEIDEPGEVLVITRTFNVPREGVWNAWTDPERVKRWWGPRGFTTSVSEIDPREGGRYFICMRSPEERTYCSVGTYQLVVPLERLVMTDSFADEQGNAVPATYYGMSPEISRTMEIRVTFEGTGSRTTVTLQHFGLPEGRDRENARGGWNESFDKMAELLKQEGSFGLVAPPRSREIRVSRVFHASPSEVFRAYVEPPILERWWGPEDLSTTVEKMEPRPGGVWRVVQRDPSGNQFAFHGVYHEVTPPWRIIETFEFEGIPGYILLETLTFEEVEEGTLLTDQMIFQSIEARDLVLGSGMKETAAATLDRLEGFLAGAGHKISQREGDRGYIACSDVRICVPLRVVWEALTDPERISRYMFGTTVLSDWVEGHPITWSGEWEGRPYKDHGILLRVEPEHLLQYTHYSPLSGLPDTSEHYHTVTVELKEEGSCTRVRLTQDNNPTETVRAHSQRNWEEMLDRLKTLLEPDPVRRMFENYEKAFAELDTEKSAGFFADTFISAGPRGAIAQSKAEFLTMAHQAADFYRSVGQTSAKILSLQELPISDLYSLVKVHWGVTFEKTGDRLIEFDVSYLVQKTGPEPQILLFIAHQDEEDAMRKLGVLGNARPDMGPSTG